MKIMVAVAGRGLKRRPRRLGQDGRGWTSRCNGDESWGQAGVRFGGGAGKTGCLKVKEWEGRTEACDLCAWTGQVAGSSPGVGRPE